MCAVVAVEKLYADYGARVAKLPDVQEGLGELMGYVKWGLMRDGRIPPEGEREGVEGLLRFADGMFEKAVRWERVLVGGGKRSVRGSADWGTVKRLYFNAWEFFGVVSWMEKKRNGFHWRRQRRPCAQFRSSECRTSFAEARTAWSKVLARSRTRLTR